jgi:hypothetical protein
MGCWTMAYAQVLNNIGTGQPKLKMRLVAYGRKEPYPKDWPCPKDPTKPPYYEINYQSWKPIPGSPESQSDKQWSAWNIYDEQDHYFGTLTLQCDSDKDKVWIKDRKKDYNPPPPDNMNRNYLADFSLGHIRGSTPSLHRLHVARVYADLHPPFPDTPLATPAKRGAHWDAPFIELRTKGPKIVNEQGKEVWLKGLNRPSLEWGMGQYLSPLDIETMRGWGANVIRIPLNRISWKDSADRTKNGSYKQIVDAMIYHAIKNHMAVILGLHAPQDFMAPPEAIEFWKDIATTYRDFGTVLFDLFNEPWDHGRANSRLDTEFSKDELNLWLHGGDKIIDKKPHHYVGYQTLLDTVREVGATNICLVGGLDYAYRLEFVNKDFCVKDKPAKDRPGNDKPGIVYCSHLYNGRGTEIKDDTVGIDGFLYGPPVKGKRSRFAENFEKVCKNFPVMITEFGCNVGGSRKRKL